MKILVLGGDGYLGWPTSMHLSALGHDVAVADSYLRRDLARQNDVEPLFDVPNLDERVRIWQRKTGNTITKHIGDLRCWDFISGIMKEFQPDAVVHYAEQPSAPFSMLDRRSATLTINNNLEVTANLIFAVREFCPNTHIVKLGTMGEYGTPNIDIEEGWLEIEHNNRKDKLLFPRQAGSLYHTTKIMDTDLLWFYVRTWDLRVTDLMQGPVYGMFTEHSRADESLLPFFSYDELFGTVLNRFIVQAVAGIPLTVYGKGGQIRGFLNIIDTCNCVSISVHNPAEKGELRIFNQFTETFSVNHLAEMVRRVGDGMGLEIKINSIENPRKEKEDHYYNPAHTGLLELGLQPNYLTDEVLSEMLEFVIRHKDKIQVHKIFRGTKWA